MSDSAKAGPSKPASTQVRRDNAPRKRTKLAPPLPSGPRSSTGPTPPLKSLQGIKTKRRDSTHPGFGRDVVFVTRKVSLGALMGRCKGLLVDEEHKAITLYAMGAAIPHALLLLHALLDLLPFSQRALWYEIKTGSVECTDEVEAEIRIGAVEVDEPSMKKRVNSTIQIDLHVGARPRAPTDSTGKNKGRARLGKRARQALRAKQHSGDVTVGEEEMFNQGGTAALDNPDGTSDEEVEQVEEK